VRELRLHRSHLGIEKMMLDALAFMSSRYDRVLVLEDDCFPLEGGVAAFEAGLRDIADRPDIYSVYGHHFGNESPDNREFPRFQGWGWAAHADRIRSLLPELRSLFAMDEESYCAWIASEMTDDVRYRLDVTPGRNVLSVLQKFFSWDSATAFLTAQRGMMHYRTEVPAVVNTGIHEGIGHFTKDSPHLRKAPFNMITLNEAWTHYDRTTLPCGYERTSYGLDALDVRLLEFLRDEPPKFFIEVGAHDGVTQSNSVLLEKNGWNGLLIEANPVSYARCVKARPNAIVEHAACVAADARASHVLLTDVGLMSLTASSSLMDRDRETWLHRGEGFTGRPRQEITVPAATISALLDKHGIAGVDLLLLDVEGGEVDVLRGLDLTRHAPRYILAEDAYMEGVKSYLEGRGYERIAVLLERKHARDCLYRRVEQRTPRLSSLNPRRLIGQ
jgi:FkbM family methyltransferase